MLSRLGRKPGQWAARYPALSAVFLGALTVLGFAPFNLYYLPILTLALLFWLWLDSTPKQAFRIGLGFGLGEMAFGVSWLHISIDQFGNVGPVLAWAATALFVAFIAVFFALSGGLARRLGGRALTQAVWIFPAVWGLLEWLRGWILTGFPWLSLGYAQLDSPLSGFAPLLGVYGVGWLSALVAGLILGVFLPGRRFACALASCSVLIAGAALSKQEWTAPLGKPIKVSLIQANIPQQQKWLPSMRLPTLALYSRLTRQQQQSDLVIWPETAVPDYLHRVNDLYLRPLAQQMAQRGAHLLLGVPVLDLDNGRYYNAAVVAGRGEEAYFKRHLVPFGEFLPLQGLLRTLLDFMSIPMSDFAAGQSPRPLLRIGSMSAGISICYEDAFGDEVIQALPKAAYLVNMSNDAWFGDSLAPHQHLQMAQMRALESGRALLRATNTGISALIGHRGELLQASKLFEQRVLSGDIQPRTGATPYVRFGNALAVGLMSLVVALLMLGRVFSRLKAKFL